MIALIAAVALTSAQPRSVLFVGNSFTFGALSDAMTYRKDSVTDLNGDGIGGVPALFKRFADEAGLRYQISLETSPGKTLAWHLANKRAVIDQPWDQVVLQEHSTLDPENPGDATSTTSAARTLTNIVRGQNPKVDISLVATWSRPDLTYLPGKHWSGKPIQQMALDVRGAEDQVRANVPAIARVIPVGQAFNCAISAGIADPNPYDGLTQGQVDLWATDHYHASTYGYYLEALTVFAAITGRDATKLGPNEQAAHDLGLAPSVVSKLQKIAWNVVHRGRCD